MQIEKMEIILYAKVNMKLVCSSVTVANGQLAPRF